MEVPELSGLVQLLHICPEHYILDMNGCWSKVLAEALHRGLSQSHINLPPGLLVANTCHPDQLESLCAEVPGYLRAPVVFTCCQPHRFPQISTVRDPRKDDVRFTGERVLSFDSVVCEVTCSSKTRQPWHMHPLQLRSLQRGLQFLSPGGKLMYVTRCDNPIENEAVVATCLASQGVKLIPISAVFESQLFDPGRVSWSVPSPENDHSYHSWEEVPHRLRGGKILQTMFPPDPISELQKCVHVSKGSQHLFVALFQKSTAITTSTPQRMPVDDVDEKPLNVRPGANVIVKSNGAPAVIVGAGQKAFKGLIKIRYPDQTTYHVELEHLEIERTSVLVRLLELQNLQQILLGISTLLLAVWNRSRLWRMLRKPPSLFNLSLSLLLSLFAWRFLHRMASANVAVTGSQSKAQRGFVDHPKGSRLVKRCAKVPQAVLAFARFFGIACPEIEAADGAGMVLQNLCYRQVVETKMRKVKG